MFERFTRAARDVVVRATHEARQMSCRHIGTEHVLLALLSPEAGIAYQVLSEAGIEAARVRADVRRVLGPPPKLLDEADAAALRTIGIDLDVVLARIQESLGRQALHPHAHPRRRGLLRRGADGRSRFTPRAKKVLELSLRVALQLHRNYIGPEHILLGMLREGHGLGAAILMEAGLELDDLRRATERKLDRAA